MSLTNVGTTDRIIRVAVGVLLIAAPYVAANLPLWDNSTLRVVVQVVGTILLLTGIMKFCGLYRIFGLKTN